MTVPVDAVVGAVSVGVISSSTGRIGAGVRSRVSALVAAALSTIDGCSAAMGGVVGAVVAVSLSVVIVVAISTRAFEVADSIGVGSAGLVPESAVVAAAIDASGLTVADVVGEGSGVVIAEEGVAAVGSTMGCRIGAVAGLLADVEVVLADVASADAFGGSVTMSTTAAAVS